MEQTVPTPDPSPTLAPFLGGGRGISRQPSDKENDFAR